MTNFGATIIEFVVFAAPVHETFVEPADPEECIPFDRNGAPLPVLEYRAGNRRPRQCHVAINLFRVGSTKIEQEALKGCRTVSAPIDGADHFGRVARRHTNVAIVEYQDGTAREAGAYIVGPRLVPALGHPVLAQVPVRDRARKPGNRGDRRLIDDDAFASDALLGMDGLQRPSQLWQTFVAAMSEDEGHPRSFMAFARLRRKANRPFGLGYAENLPT